MKKTNIAQSEALKQTKSSLANVKETSISTSQNHEVNLLNHDFSGVNGQACSNQGLLAGQQASQQQPSHSSVGQNVEEDDMSVKFVSKANTMEAQATHYSEAKAKRRRGKNITSIEDAMRWVYKNIYDFVWRRKNRKKCSESIFYSVDGMARSIRYFGKYGNENNNWSRAFLAFMYNIGFISSKLGCKTNQDLADVMGVPVEKVNQLYQDTFHGNENMTPAALAKFWDGML